MQDFIVARNYEEAWTRGVSALKAFDEAREFENSIAVLEKLTEIAGLQQKSYDEAKLVDQLRIRYLLTGQQSIVPRLKEKFPDLPDTPARTLLDKLAESYMSNNKEIVLEEIKKQTVFGDFRVLPYSPYLEFGSEDEIYKLIEENYEEGRYIVSLISKKTSLQKSIHLDTGLVEELNVVERESIYKLSS